MGNCILEEEKKVKDISEYLKKIQEIIEIRNEEKKFIVVYRGEPEKYPVPGRPGIFRSDYIDKEPFFEKNLFCEMTANRITSGASYLEKAVDAQHDEFPSRLLDVTYNALVALYFATTPYYKKYEENEFDGKKDGQVIVYFLPQMYCAGIENVENTFDWTVDRKEEYLQSALVQENYKLIDHIKMNTRICVQQGAFIMFQGDAYSAISEKDYETIVIDKDAKKRIREDLDTLFGINTGFIYPEPYNLFSTMGNKAYSIVNYSENKEYELEQFFSRIEGEIEYYFYKSVNLDDDDKILEIIISFETKLATYKEELKNFLEHYSSDINREVDRFNMLMRYYADCFRVYEKKHGIMVSFDQLILKKEDMVGNQL